MARLDVHRNRQSGSNFPLLLDVQANLLADLRSRLVIPLVPEGASGLRLRQLDVDVEISGIRYVLRTEVMGAVAASQLGEIVATLRQRHDEVAAAIDFLLQGF